MTHIASEAGSPLCGVFDTNQRTWFVESVDCQSCLVALDKALEEEGRVEVARDGMVWVKWTYRHCCRRCDLRFSSASDLTIHLLSKTCR